MLKVLKCILHCCFFFLDISWILYIVIAVLIIILVSSIVFAVKMIMNRRGNTPTPVELRNMQEELQVQTSRLSKVVNCKMYPKPVDCNFIHLCICIPNFYYNQKIVD